MENNEIKKMKLRKTKKIGKIILSIIGILLAMSAGGLLTVYLQAENEGWLTIPSLEIHTDRWTNFETNEVENVWLMVCGKYIPYWQGAIERARAGYFTGSCSVLKTLWRK